MGLARKHGRGHVPVRALVRLVGSRCAWALGILLVLSFALFGVLSSLPGDPVDLLVTANPNVQPEDVARLKRLRGLDKPWPVRWLRWLVGHAEALAPPTPPEEAPVIVEMSPDGVAKATVFGTERVFQRPGVHVVVDVIRDAHGLEAVQQVEVLVAPPLSPIPRRREGDPVVLDESERQLGGSTEDAAGIGRHSDAELAQAARAVGRALPMASPRVFPVDDSGQVDIDAQALCEGEGLRFDVVAGPGGFVDGRYRHRFEGPGQSAVLFDVTAPDGRSARGGFAVDHGLVRDPTRFHRGAVFLLVGDTEALGYSSTYKRPVWELLFGTAVPRAPGMPLEEHLARVVQSFGRVQNTLVLMVPALLLSLLLAVPLGVLAASRRGSAVDHVILGMSTLGLSVPAFWLGIMAIAVFAVVLRVLPAGGIQTPGLPPVLVDVLADRLAHAALPVMVLACAYAAPWIRWVRSSVIEVLPADHVRTAKAKGLPPPAVLLHHALRNALLPLVTVVALAAPQLFAGALLTETVFAWPGVGRLQYEAILNNDSYVAIVVFLVSASLVLLANLVADVLYVVVDPRLRRNPGGLA